ncbi:putative selenium delivery protein YdfZ [Aeromonas salmonicida]|uniref:putative selenium delivery protein YdfZ n=1 Tax=Aeromonas salmonicida TaxID=645 RepID=UPI00232AD08F|nr:putative selenium delivery protein YdfZ [Aeromonas salmonicida]MDM5068492.1 putative selenium delivery protein YdfZ [Aeromonas salmonicida]WCH22974.1 putative selenium delivery protein YdfZ [Aeromonas salmonicida]
MKIYDRNRNALKLGQRVMIAATGAVDFLKEAQTDNMTPYQAEHEKCVLLANTQERYAPIELIRLG